MIRAQESQALVSLPLGSERAHLYSGYDEFFFMLRAEIAGANNGNGYLSDCYFLTVGPLNVTVTYANGGFDDASSGVDRNHRPWISVDRKVVSFDYSYNFRSFGNYINGGYGNKTGSWQVPHLMYVGNNIS